VYLRDPGVINLDTATVTIPSAGATVSAPPQQRGQNSENDAQSANNAQQTVTYDLPTVLMLACSLK